MTGTALILFTIFHVLLSLVGILAGLIAITGFLRGRIAPTSNRVFLWTTGLTSITGFFFPFRGMTPGIMIGIVCSVTLACSLVARRRGAPRTYIATVCFAETLNVVVLITQCFEKISVLHSLAPTGHEPIVAVLQIFSLVAFGILALIAIKKVRLS
jgi:hypothetical protein